jgi:hypothetical protein
VLNLVYCIESYGLFAVLPSPQANPEPKKPVRTSHETHYVSITEPRLLFLIKREREREKDY